MNVLIADDHELVRDTISAYLRDESDIEIRVAHDFPSAAAVLRRDGPFDLVLLDYSMPGMNGLRGLIAARALNAGRPVAIFSGTASRDVAERAIAAGATGFLPKTIAASSLAHVMRLLASGERYAPVRFMTERDAEAREPPAIKLTSWERDVVRRLAQGWSNREIARELDAAESTVKLHLKTLCRKLGARNRTHAAMIARDAGLA